MIIEFKYSPPAKYIFQAFLGLIGSVMFAWISYGIPEWYVKIFTALFSLILIGYAIGFYKVSFSNRNGNKIVLKNNSIVLPFLIDGQKVRIKFDDIEEVDKYETYSTEVISIHSRMNKGFIEIEKNWMKKREFQELYRQLTNIVKAKP